MPRKLRLEYPGAVYHVMNRGNQRQNIVRDDVDRHRFLNTLAETMQSDRSCQLDLFPQELRSSALTDRCGYARASRHVERGRPRFAQKSAAQITSLLTA